MVGEAEQVKSVLDSFKGRTLCPECADLFAEILDAVKSTPEPVQRPPNYVRVAA